MKFFLFVLLFATVSASSASGNGGDGSRLEQNAISYINITTSPFTRIMNLRVTLSDIVYSTPATVLVGTNTNVLRCLQEDPDVCEDFHVPLRTVTALLVIGEYYYVGLGGGVLNKCDLHRKESCEVFLENLGSQVDSLASAGGELFAGLYNGTIWRCRLHDSSSCRHFLLQEGGFSVFSLIPFQKYVYAGFDSKLMRCSVSDEKCTLVATLDETIMGLTTKGNHIFAVTWDGSIWKCSVKSNARTMSCKSKHLDYKPLRDIALYNEVLYTVQNNNGIYACKWDSTNCTSYGNFHYSYSAVFVYGVYQMVSRFKDEDKCVTQGETKCPSTVTYYHVQQRVLLEVHVRHGRLYDTSGLLVDTSDADEGRSGPAAIFAMAPDGRIMLSKKHAPGQLHTSSLVAGNPVSGAGEMVVKNGVIEKMTTCSDHYLPDLNLNRQVIQSLRAQGYTDDIVSLMCDENRGDELQTTESNDQ